MSVTADSDIRAGIRARRGLLLVCAVILAAGLLLAAAVLQWQFSRFSVRDGDGYTVAYNFHWNEYYVDTSRDYVTLSLQVPSGARSMSVSTEAPGGVREEQGRYAPGEPITLARQDGKHFLLQADYGDRVEQLTVYFVPGGLY